VFLSDRNDWTRPKALAIPKEGYFKLEQGKYGPVFREHLPVMASRSLPKSSRARSR